MKIFYKISLLCLPLLLGACTDLDQSPYETLGGGNTYKTPLDAQFWANGMYEKLRGNAYGNKMYATDMQSDLLNMGRGKTALAEIHRWSFVGSDETTQRIWQDIFNAIQNINLALDGIDEISEQNQVVRNTKGELYLGRAYYYTYLVTHFCKAYKEATAGEDLGMPIYNFQVSNFPPRSSLKTTYEYILSDIAQAEELLATKQGQVGALTFTIDAVKALKARVLLYKEDWQQAYQEAKALVDANTYPLANTQAALENIWYNDDNAESIVQLFATVAGRSELPQANNIYLEYGATRLNGVLVRAYNPRMLPTQTIYDLYDAPDFRKEVYFLQGQVVYAGQAANVYVVNKYPDNRALKTNPDGAPTYMHKPKIFRIAEQYLIAAEAAYHNSDQANARTYLNALRAARGLTAVTSSGDDLLTEIKNERTRELAFEGFRMHDLKRWQQDIVRGTPQNLDVIETDPATEYYQLNRSYTDYKNVWPISSEDVQFSEGVLEQNPNW